MSVFGAALLTCTDVPLMMWSSPHRDCATSGSRKVTNEKARNGFGMKTSVTSPYLQK